MLTCKLQKDNVRNVFKKNKYSPTGIHVYENHSPDGYTNIHMIIFVKAPVRRADPRRHTQLDSQGKKFDVTLPGMGEREKPEVGFCWCSTIF